MGYAGRVLIIVENLPVPFDTRVWQEANTLRDAGYKVSIICPVGKGFEKKYEQIDGISIYRHYIPKESEGILGYLREYTTAFFLELYLSFKIFLKERFDVIHACNPPDILFLHGLIFKIFGVKFIFDHHDVCPELFSAKYGRKGLLYKLMILLERLTFAAADISIATNESYRKIAITRGKMDPNKVFVVRSGPDLLRMKIKPAIEELKRGRRYMAGYVGVIGKQEGMDYLIDAVNYICNIKGRRDIIFVILGKGPYLENAIRKCSLLKLNEDIIFTGRVEDSVMLDYLNTSDVCINPDEFNEMNNISTMNKVLEYMALGKPIVQFDLKEGRYSAGKASLYAKTNNSIDLAEKLMFLIDNADVRNEMGVFGRRRIVEELNWGITGRKLIEAYDTLRIKPECE